MTRSQIRPATFFSRYSTVVSAVQKKFYLSALLARKIKVFAHDATSHSLTLEKDIPIFTSGDNLMGMDDGRLLIGAQPNLLRCRLHLKDPRANRSPWQAFT